MPGPGSGSYALDKLALLQTDYGYVVAWSEGSGGEYQYDAARGAYSIVRLQRLDVNGRALEAAAAVRAKEENIDEVEPTLIHFNGSIGLLWSRSTHYSTCGGCIPDKTIELVLLDPIALRPVSDVVKISSRQAGFSGRSTATIRSNILASFLWIYHANNEPGFAAFHCD